MAKDFPVPNVSSAKVEKACPRVREGFIPLSRSGAWATVKVLIKSGAWYKRAVGGS